MCLIRGQKVSSEKPALMSAAGGGRFAMLELVFPPRWCSGLARRPFKPEITGSNPVRGTISKLETGRFTTFFTTPADPWFES